MRLETFEVETLCGVVKTRVICVINPGVIEKVRRSNARLRLHPLQETAMHLQAGFDAVDEAINMLPRNDLRDARGISVLRTNPERKGCVVAVYVVSDLLKAREFYFRA